MKLTLALLALAGSLAAQDGLLHARPIHPFTGQVYCDETSKPRLLKAFDGDKWIPVDDSQDCVFNVAAGGNVTYSSDSTVFASSALTVGGSATGDWHEVEIHDKTGNLIATRDKDGVVHITGDPEEVVDVLINALEQNAKQSSEYTKAEAARYDQLWQLAHECTVQLKKQNDFTMDYIHSVQKDLAGIQTALKPVSKPKEKK